MKEVFKYIIIFIIFLVVYFGLGEVIYDVIDTIEPNEIIYNKNKDVNFIIAMIFYLGYKIYRWIKNIKKK